MPGHVLLHHPRRLVGVGRPGQGAAGLGYGGDYNPEQWPEEVWAEDARLMTEAGVTFVTLAVFAWARIEPEPGVRDLDWLERVMDLMDRHDIAVDLATATASPPPWLARESPDVLPVSRDGRRLAYGSRQTWCPSSTAYRERSLALVEAMATRFADHPALVLWHVSNELGCHNAHCYCDMSAAAFRTWLQDRYGDLDGLNDSWGTAFWSQRYSEWAEVMPPRTTTAVPNPTQDLDFRRFSSDALLAQHRAERDLLRQLSPGVPVTTNFMLSSHINALDYHRWAPEQDVISNDHYLDGRLPHPHRELSLCADWTRGLAGGDPWVLMEHSPSAVNWQPRNFPKAAGEMRRTALQHVARGADAVGFFQWRASRSGSEKYHSAMVPHAGRESRVFREVVELGETMRRLGEVAGTTTQADVAILLDHECWWAVERGSTPASDLSYLDRALALHGAFARRGVTVDVCHPSEDLSRYRLVVAPTLHVLRDADAARIDAYVRDGGHLLVTYFSGIVDENDHIRLGGYPGALREVLGIVVEEFSPLRDGVAVTLEWSDGQGAGESDTWIEDLRLDGAEQVAAYRDGPLPGVAAVTRHEVGAGVAWYVAARTGAAATAELVDRVLADAGCETTSLPEDVEVVRRAGGGRTYVFVLNHGSEQACIETTGHDLVHSKDVSGRLVVEPGGVACVREEVD